MSTYLLLRNNKESGPFTLEEIRRMALKAYDLVWVEGKSAAWRYPGEIPEFSSFAPQVPEQPYDRFYKAPPPPARPAEMAVKQGELQEGVSDRMPGQPPAGRDGNQQQANAGNAREANRESVYINMSASEKKGPAFRSATGARPPIELNWDEPIRLSEKMSHMPDTAKKTSGRGLLIACVVLLFAAGMCTGFFISNRRNFYSGSGNTSHSGSVPVMSKEFPQASPEQTALSAAADSVDAADRKAAAGLTETGSRSPVRSRKKTTVPAPAKKDSAGASGSALPVKPAVDSARIRQEAENKKAELAARISAHPEDYLPITAGKFRTGVLGGISEFPVTLSNRSGVTLDEVVVAVDYILHNKKIFKTENLSFQNVAAGATVTSEAPKSSRGVKIAYRLIAADAQQIKLRYSNP